MFSGVSIYIYMCIYIYIYISTPHCMPDCHIFRNSEVIQYWWIACIAKAPVMSTCTRHPHCPTSHWGYLLQANTHHKWYVCTLGPRIENWGNLETKHTFTLHIISHLTRALALGQQLRTKDNARLRRIGPRMEPLRL